MKKILRSSWTYHYRVYRTPKGWQVEELTLEEFAEEIQGLTPRKLRRAPGEDEDS